MLKLYNANGSVCSVKARIGLAEKELEWEDVLLDLRNGDQNTPEYRKLNPNSVVPTLVDNDIVVLESSVILQYIDDIGSGPRLMPTDSALRVEAQIWLMRCIEIHQAIATMSFATAHRHNMLNSKTAEEIDRSIAAMPNPFRAAKRRDLLDNGTNSKHLDNDFYILSRVLEDMNAALQTRQWMNGDTFGMTDTALLAYIDRLDRIAMSGLWEQNMPRISEWLNEGRARPSYSRAMYDYVSQDVHAKNLSISAQYWPEIKRRWDEYLLAQKK